MAATRFRRESHFSIASLLDEAGLGGKASGNDMTTLGLRHSTGETANRRSIAAPICTQIVASGIITGATLLAGAVPASADWPSAHGNSANTGFAMVDTAPAYWPSAQQPLGFMAPGANPVVGPDGTLYVGNLQGQLRAFHADGTPYWTRQINSLHGGIFAAPAVGADGSIYVVSTIHYRDHRGGVTNDRNDSFLHKFLPGGAWVFATPFPEEFSDSLATANRGATTAPPNIWRWNGTEAIVVPVAYKRSVNPADPRLTDLRLVAFSTAGTVLASQLVTRAEYPATTSVCGDLLCKIIQMFDECINFDGGWPFGCGFFASPYVPLAVAGFPLPGVAIRPDPQGGAPLVMVTDGRRDKVAYAFSPQAGFSQVARSQHFRRQFTTPPMVRPNGETLTGTRDGYLTVTAPNFAQYVIATDLGTLTAAPTRLANGGLVVVSREGIMTVIRGYLLSGSIPTERRIHRVGCRVLQSRVRRQHQRARDLRRQNHGVGGQHAMGVWRTFSAGDRPYGARVRHCVEHLVCVCAAVAPRLGRAHPQLRAVAADLNAATEQEARREATPGARRRRAFRRPCARS